MDQIPADADRDFTASTFIVRDSRVLLLKHTKLGVWLQPGGHIEEDELPHAAARREAREETGITVEISSACGEPSAYDRATYDVPVPLNVNVHRIREGHWHCDFAFLATVITDQDPTHGHEQDGMQWIGAEVLRQEDRDVPENVRNTALRALRLVSGDV